MLRRLRPTVVALVGLSLLALARPASAAGLLVPTDRSVPPLRVVDHLVDARIRDGVAFTTVTQTFRNDTKQRLEATYLFPLPDEADLTDFRMTFKGELVQGKVLPAEEARTIYENVVRQMKDPGLIELVGRRLLQMRIFPIEPESDTTIRLEYQQVCRPLSGMVGYHYPLRTRSTSGQAYGTVRFAVSIDASAPLKNIWSPTHAVEIVRKGDERHADVAYEASGGSLEDDFILLYATDASDLGLSVVASKPAKDEAGHFVLMLTPKQLWPEQEAVAQDVVFVVDTSGSMAGEKLDQAKASLRYCVEQLSEKDRFGVVRFSTGFDLLFDEVQPASRDAKDRAAKWIGQFSAAGGTNISDTLAEVLRMKKARDAGGDDAAARPFVVVFLTDGRGNREPLEIMNTLADAGGEDAHLRIFPFGVGHDVNVSLLDGLSQRYHGKPTYVQPGENLELVLGDFFAVVSRPVLTDLRLTLPDIGATERFPATLGDLYHGQQLILAGQFDHEGAGAVTLTAQRGDERVEFSWPNVRFAHAEGVPDVGGVWAGRKIAFLLDQIRQNGESQELIDEILALSIKYGIQTPYTSWLVNPEGSDGTPRPMPVLRGRVAPAEAAGRAFEGRAGGRGGVGLGGGGPASSRRAAPGSGGGGLAAGSAAGDELYRFSGELDLAEAERAMHEDSGKLATLLATKVSEMRTAATRDGDRLNAKSMPIRELDGTMFVRVGDWLVDEAYTAETKVIAVKLASDAWFDVVGLSDHFRKVLAKEKRIVVVVTPGVAVLVAPDDGAETLDDAAKKSLGM